MTALQNLTHRTREATRRWHEANPEYGRKQSRRWREANLEKARAREAAYRAPIAKPEEPTWPPTRPLKRTLHACTPGRPPSVQTPEDPAPWPRMNGRRIARGDPPPPSLPPLIETIPHTWGSNYRMGRRRRRG